MSDRSYRADVALCLLALLATAVAACDTKTISHAAVDVADPSHDPKQRAEALDQHACRAMADGKSEAREWLDDRHASHAVWKWSKESARKAVAELYDAGAPRIWVIGAVRTARNVELAGEFAVVLPAERAARQRVFEWIARWESDVDLPAADRTQNVGQKYFVLNTD